MNEKTPKKGLPGNLNKTELNALIDAMTTKKEKKQSKGPAGMTEKELKESKIGKIRSKKKLKDMKIDDMSYKPLNLSEEQLLKRAMDSLLAKGGEVKKYMGGGSVHKKKNKMLTTKGWGASRKT